MGKPKIAKSRAAKRAVTPPLNVGIVPRNDEQLTGKEKVAILGLRGDAGISKKKSNRKKQLSAKQKARKELAMDKAEAALEKLEHRTEESKQKARIIKTRRVNWEALNDKLEDEVEQVTEVDPLAITVR